jgi:hypothetical protein
MRGETNFHVRLLGNSLVVSSSIPLNDRIDGTSYRPWWLLTWLPKSLVTLLGNHVTVN